ncbi:MAG: serine/threonine protein kinase, partial [Phycisphaerales bacterium]
DIDGHLWITDFGLAYMESDPGLTMTGDILGTVRYMSPEQALAKRIPIDHRTDIYSLGVTLYELLTLQPAFTGRDRQELLRQIAFEEPRRPRRLNSAIPAELETIVLKAVGKSPEERYATAQELADDLQRFLEDKPIKAKRPSLIDRAAKWSRRHRAVVASGVALLIMAVVALSVSTALIWQEQARTAAALADAQQARSQEAEQRERAEANFRKAREAVDQMLTQVAEQLPRLPGMPEAEDSPDVTEIKQALLEEALAFYEGFRQDRSSDPLVRNETAHAYLRVAEITKALGQDERAKETYRGAIRLLEELVVEFPDEPDYCRDLASACSGIALLLAEAGQFEEAEAPHWQAVDLLEQLTVDFRDVPMYREQLALARAGSAPFLVKVGDSDQAKEQAAQAIAIQEGLVADHPGQRRYRKQLAQTRIWHAYHEFRGILNGARQSDAADEVYHRALEVTIDVLLQEFAVVCPDREIAIAWQRGLEKLQNTLITEAPDNLWYHAHLAFAYRCFGEALRFAGHSTEAVEAQRAGVKAYSQLIQESLEVGSTAGTRGELANTLIHLGKALESAGQHAEAEEAHRAALEVYSRLVEEFPEDPRWVGRLSICHFQLQRVLNALERDEEAEAEHLKAIALKGKFAAELIELANRGPDGVALAIERARTINIEEDELMPFSWIVCGLFLTIGNDADRGAAAIQKGIDTEDEADRFMWQYRELGVALWSAGQWTQARDAFEKVIAGCEDTWPTLPPDARCNECTVAYLLGLITDEQYVSDCCGGSASAFPWRFVAQRMEIEGRIDEAIGAYEKALELWGPETELWKLNATLYRLQVLTGERDSGGQRASDEPTEPGA